MPVFPTTFPVPYHWDFIKNDHKSANAKKERKESKSGGLANSFSVFRLESSSPRAREFPELGTLVDGLNQMTFFTEKLFYLGFNPLSFLLLYLAGEP